MEELVVIEGGAEKATMAGAVTRTRGEMIAPVCANEIMFAEQSVIAAANVNVYGATVVTVHT